MNKRTVLRNGLVLVTALWSFGAIASVPDGGSEEEQRKQQEEQRLGAARTSAHFALSAAANDLTYVMSHDNEAYFATEKRIAKILASYVDDQVCNLDGSLLQIGRTYYSFQNLLNLYFLNNSDAISPTDDEGVLAVRHAHVERLRQLVAAYKHRDKAFLEAWPASFEKEKKKTEVSKESPRPTRSIFPQQVVRSRWSFLSQKLPYILGGVILGALTVLGWHAYGQRNKKQAGAKIK